MSPAHGRPTIYDVARRAGVSKSLVSLVLQGSERVSPKRRQAVLEAIDVLGYRPSQAASALAGSRTKSIGVVIDDFENLWFVDLLRGVRDVLSETGLHISVADRHLNGHLGQHPVDGFLARGVEGLVIAMEPDRRDFQTIDVPVVVAGGRRRVPMEADWVANDDRAGARLATRHLVELGHTQIAHVTGAGGAAALRRASYTATMKKAGLAPVIAGHQLEPTEQAGYRVTLDLLGAHRGITAVFTANDAMALGALAAIRDRGLRVPQDVSLVGYDNSPLASSRLLGLTTVDDRSEDVGTAAARTLLARIAEPGREPTRTLLTPTLVHRSTTGPRPANA